MQDRLCTLCEFNEIEDECHFLFKCSLYNDLRNNWIRNITDKTPDFVEMDTTTKFKVTRKFTWRASKRRCVLLAAVWREPGVIIRRVLFAAGWREPGVVCYHI